VWKEAVVAQFKGLFQSLPGGLRKTTEKQSQDSWSSGQDMKLRPFEYEAGMLNTQPRHSMAVVVEWW
jgi:hypothetical protein